MSKLFALAEHASSLAQDQFAANGYVLPMWIFETSRGQRIPLVLSSVGNNPEEKARTFEGIASLIRAMKPARYASIMEVWVVEGHAALEVGDDIAPSEHEDRREAVIVTAEDQSGAQIMGTHYILRPEHGRPTLSPVKWHEGGEMRGRGARLIGD